MQKKSKKIRLDQLVIERGFFYTRTQAQAAILAGEIYTEDKLLTKSGHLVDREIPLSLKSRRSRFVGRGGFKLEGALNDFHLNVQGWACLDIGSSTGGFTDCMLQQGAGNVCCVDVGKGQLHFRLRRNPRVRVMESLNARYLTLEEVGGLFDLAVIDVSFISIIRILPVIAPLLKPRSGRLLALIKPQFEVGPADIGKGGIVRNEAARKRAVHHVLEHLETFGLTRLGVRRSCLSGADGNIEYFLLAKRHNDTGT
ncbi:TlyA family RNA methyltransferase [bacterium]|nr:TlyA family RNA methyltransferase [bacterium]